MVERIGQNQPVQLADEVVPGLPLVPVRRESGYRHGWATGRGASGLGNERNEGDSALLGQRRASPEQNNQNCDIAPATAAEVATSEGDCAPVSGTTRLVEKDKPMPKTTEAWRR